MILRCMLFLYEPRPQLQGGLFNPILLLTKLVIESLNSHNLPPMESSLDMEAMEVVRGSKPSSLTNSFTMSMPMEIMA